MLLTKKTDREYGEQNKHILCEQMSPRDWECNWTPSGLELSSSSHSSSPTHTSALSTGKKTSDLSFDGWRNMDLNPPAAHPQRPTPRPNSTKIASTRLTTPSLPTTGKLD